MNDLKQRTFHVDGQKIVIKSRVKTHLGNFQGWGVNINGQQFDSFLLESREDAEDRAFAKWVAAQ
jgi:hypothetical protein